MNNSADERGATIVEGDGRILLMSCQWFIDEIVMGEACFVCGCSPQHKAFNDEHVIPAWVLRRFSLFDKQITLPTGECRHYRSYKIQCCEECNSLLGETVETPISKLLAGDYLAVSQRLDDDAIRLLFIWLSLLFVKVHLKDRGIRVHKDPRIGSEVIGDLYDWAEMHHAHAVSRTPYTKAILLPGVVGSLRVYEIQGQNSGDAWDYFDFSYDQTVVVRIGNVGIVATLNDSTAGERAWSDRLGLIDGPISKFQLREIGAMLALANRKLIYRPRFRTSVYNKTRLTIESITPPPWPKEFDPTAFGEVLLFAVSEYVRSSLIMVDGSRDQEKVAAAIASGYVRFLTRNGEFIRPEILGAEASATPS